jgi:hypothetical protein
MSKIVMIILLAFVAAILASFLLLPNASERPVEQPSPHAIDQKS